jgi:Flp pilus assembly pilin Flp
MRLAGIQVGPLAMEELALRLQEAGNDALATGLRQAVIEGDIAVKLSTEQRQQILDALEECPAGLLRLRDELRSQSAQTMGEYAVILGGLALVVVVAVVFLGGRIGDLFGGTGSSVQQPRSAPFTPPYPSGVSFPATLQDCQNGGWRDYAQFETEAECVSYVDALMP